MTKRFIIAAALFTATTQYAQQKVYTDYQFEGNSNITVTALKNPKVAQFVTADEKGKLILTDSPVAKLQAEVDELKKQVEELRNQFNAGLGQAAVENAEFEFRVFPNPSNGQFDFEFKQVVPDALVVYDVKGKEVAHMPITSNTAKVNLQNLTSGYYIINMVAGGKTLGSKNILIK